MQKISSCKYVMAIMLSFEWIVLKMCLLFSAIIDFRASLGGGVCAQDNTIKSSLTLPPKKSVAFSSDLQEPPAKPQFIHKQPPALPPKPFSRLANHSTGNLKPHPQNWPITAQVHSKPFYRNDQSQHRMNKWCNYVWSFLSIGFCLGPQ